MYCCCCTKTSRTRSPTFCTCNNMPAKGPSTWTVADVSDWLTSELELPPATAAEFKANAIAGPGEDGLYGEAKRAKTPKPVPS